MEPMRWYDQPATLGLERGIDAPLVRCQRLVAQTADSGLKRQTLGRMHVRPDRSMPQAADSGLKRQTLG